MSFVSRAMARRAVLALLILAVVPAVPPAAPAAAGPASSAPVKVVGATPQGPDARPLAVPPRPPSAQAFGAALATASSARVANAADIGARTNGKLIGTDPRSGAFSCSGTAINTPSRSIVLTAGHCVIIEGAAARKLSFVPAYDHGARPFGTFAVTATYVMPQWRHFENPDFDVAALRVAPNRFGSLVDVVGARGVATSRSRTAQFQIFGYPAAALRGEELRTCAARGLGSDPLTFPYSGPPTMPGSCDMAAGASGGGWVLGGQYVNGVTSYGYANRPDRLYSPYFGPLVAGFLRALP